MERPHVMTPIGTAETGVSLEVISSIDVAKTKFPEWSKQVVSTVVPVAVLIGWLAVWYVPAKIDSQTQPQATKLASLDAKIANLETQTRQTDAKIDGLLSVLIK